MAAAYLEKLNDRQREAVEHGVGLADGAVGGPLLIIAGAGSGKTNTLAHRVAHLIVNGADPRRILLMTFPSDLGAGTTAELEEERRLLYVAMTRARDNLTLMTPQRFFTHG